LFSRLRRKIRNIRRYSALAFGAEDRRDLRLLGLVHERLLRPELAGHLSSGGRRVIAPRLRATRGERVKVAFDHSGQIDCFNELFFDKIYELEAVGFGPDLVADCGGYCGYFSAMAAGSFPRSNLVCFEANSDNLPMLREQLAALTRPVELYDVAVFIRDGLISFSGAGVGGAVSQNHVPPAPDTRAVRCLDFPRWLRARAPRQFVWKLDIEGAEDELLPATLPLLPSSTVIFLETHHPDEKCALLLAPYRAGGFSLREIRRRPSAARNFDFVEWLLIRA
jgi:FkbM family methyltransferase